MASTATTTFTTENVLKLRPGNDDDYQSLDQKKQAQYSIRPRLIINNPHGYEDASATAKVDKKIILSRSETFLKNAPYHDFRDDLIQNGYAVVKGAVPKLRAQDYESQMYDWVKSFKSTKDLDFNDKSTWIEKNLPAHSPNNVYAMYSSSHEKFIWDARQEPGVIDAFSKIWGTEELIVSFDGFNFSLPNRTDVPRSAAWPHVDQSPLKDGLQCVQGIINLSNATGYEDGSLVVFKGSNKILEEFFAGQTDKSTWDVKDSYNFSPLELKWFEAKGCEIIRVKLEPGDLILWDSRTIHYGGAPGPSSNQTRSIIYASYSPREFASEESLATKKKIFESWRGTTHWAHDNVVERDYVPLTHDYQPDPEDRKEPWTKPEITDKLLKLAGVIPY